tara:strand:+ start:421 stop:771 length:351 start_codon:yes stop_codon:yes gene_type:complete
MEYIPPKRISRPVSARPYNRIRRVQSAKGWLDDSPQTTARTIESSEPSTARSLNDFFDDDDEEEEQEEWVTKVNEATSVRDAMKELFKSEPETFYLYGQDILKMLMYRFEHKLDED